MTGKEKFDMRMGISGGSVRNERINSMRDITDKLFMDDPSYRDDVLSWVNKTKIPARIYEYKNGESGAPYRKIQTCYSYEINAGDIYVIGSEGCWICVDAYLAHQMNWQGTLRYCNYNLRFILNDEVMEYPVVIAGNSSGGEVENNELILGDSQYSILLTYDENTVQISNGFRFLIDKNTSTPTAFKVTQADTVSYSRQSGGIIRLVVEEDQYSTVLDNKELMIANYFGREPTGTTLPTDEYEQSDLRLVIVDPDQDGSIIIGSSKQFPIHIYSANTEVLDFKIDAEIKQDSMFAKVESATSNGVVLSAYDNEDNIGRTFTLYISCDEFGLESSLELKVVGFW